VWEALIALIKEDGRWVDPDGSHPDVFCLNRPFGKGRRWDQAGSLIAAVQTAPGVQGNGLVAPAFFCVAGSGVCTAAAGGFGGEWFQWPEFSAS